MLNRSSSKSTSSCDASITKGSKTNETSQLNIEHFVHQILGENCSVLGAVTTKAIYQAVCIEDNIEWKILGNEVVVALSWEHKSCTDQSKRAHFHGILVSTGRIIVEEYISDNSVYEVFSNTFHAYRTNQLQVNSVFGIHFASSTDAQYLAEVFDNVLALELHRKTWSVDIVAEQLLNHNSDASGSHFTVTTSKLHRDETNRRAIDESNRRDSSRKQRRPLSSSSTVHSETSNGTRHNCHLEKGQIDSVCHPNPDRGLLIESDSNAFLRHQQTTSEHSCQQEMVFPVSQPTSNFVDQSVITSKKDISLDRPFPYEQRNSVGQLSQLPIDISRCTVSEKYSLRGSRQSFQLQKHDISLLSTACKAHSSISIASNNSNQEMQVNNSKNESDTKVECTSCVYSEDSNSFQQTISSSTGKSNRVTQKPETKLPPQIVYENLLVELNLVSHEKIQECIQSILREGLSNRSTNNFCRSQKLAKILHQNK
ncbi:hypothetical protein Gasu2_26390 [Galdieria sulphuraria]|nr:hypothetical protein Gasu2_26390 [Galdieria sulphuraria]